MVATGWRVLFGAEGKTLCQGARFFSFLGGMKTFEGLFAELAEKAKRGDEASGTVRALRGGVHGIGKKVLEEAGEVWIAAEHESDERLAEEVSQLLYHTQVLLLARGVSLEEVYKKL